MSVTVRLLVHWGVLRVYRSSGHTAFHNDFLLSAGIGLVSRTKPNMWDKKRQSNKKSTKITGVMFCGGVVNEDSALAIGLFYDFHFRNSGDSWIAILWELSDLRFALRMVAPVKRTQLEHPKG